MSVAKTIADRCAAVVAALASPPALTQVRKTDAWVRGDAAPACVITMQDEQPDGWATLGDGTSDDRGTWGKSYTIGVTLYRTSGGTLVAGADDNPQMLQDIQRALAQPLLTGAATVWDSELVRHPEFENQAFADGMEVSRFALVFRSAEQRVG